jgi:glycosyltransferase involved in cell wall biosynthesis
VFLDMTKIMFLQPYYAHYRDQLFSLLAQRHDIHFIYGSVRSYIYDKGKPDNKIYFSSIDHHFKSKWLGTLYFLLKEKPEIVISSNAPSFFTLISFIYSKLFHKKMILWNLTWKKPSYEYSNLRKIPGHLMHNIEKKLILKSDALVVGGTAAYNYALSLGRPQESIFIAPQCSNDIKLQQSQNHFKGKRKMYTFLYLSRIVPYKGLDLLIKAFSQLEKDRNDIFLLVAGDGPFKDYCINLSKELKVENLEFLGSISSSDTREIFNKADVFVLPSYTCRNLWEAWGLVINEAMSMELPVISTTATGASYDIIYNGVNGFIIKENDVTELYHAMKKILDLDLKKMGLLSRKIFDEKNNFNQMADAFTKAINYVNKKKKLKVG